MDNNISISLRNVSKTFRLKEEDHSSIRETLFNFRSPSKMHIINALSNVNLEVKKGEFLGIIGRNGSGKSTLLKIIMQAMMPDKGGEVRVNGKAVRLALGMGFDANLSARENIYINASILGMTFKEIGQRFDEIIQFAGLEGFTDTKIKYYSSGMRSRLAFSIAIKVEADILLMDEFFGGVGDIDFRKKSEKAFQEALIKEKTIIHVSHNLNTIEKHCDRVLLLNYGNSLYLGEPKEALRLYKALFKKK